MLINLIFICFISALALIFIKNFVSSIKNSRKDKINKNKSLIKEIEEIEIDEEERWNNPMYNTEVIESKISILDKFKRGELKFKNSSLDKDFTRLVVDKNKKKLAIDEYLEGKGTTYRLNPDDINIKDSKIIARKSQKKKTKGVGKASKIIAKIKKTENTKEEYFDNGELRTLVSLDLNELSHGICLELYSNGNVNKIQNFKHGVPHGSSKKYFNNGKIHDDYVFKNGFMHGIQTTFYDNGNKDIITHYKNGRAHGICEQYYPCGNLETKSIYEEGKIEGVHVHYKENGEPLEQQIFHNGNDITFKLFEHLMKNEEHTIKSGLIKEGVQNSIETLENIYDYLKNNDFTLNDKTF